MSKISIVTAFYDIGRGNWNGWIQRTTDTYFERFSHLLSLDNDITVFTSPDLVDRLKDLTKNRAAKTNIVAYDLFSECAGVVEEIRKVQESPDYQSQIAPEHKDMPEYWSPEFIFVNIFKPSFVRRAIDMELCDNDLVAWIDFGYCRSPAALGGHTTWSYDFDPTKIHMFAVREVPLDLNAAHLMTHNEVYIIGTYYVAHKSLWAEMERLMYVNFREKLSQQLVDDDQSFLVMCYQSKPELFEIHQLHGEWFEAFTYFNTGE